VVLDATSVGESGRETGRADCTHCRDLRERESVERGDSARLKEKRRVAAQS
jgi:hypothetical protein